MTSIVILKNQLNEMSMCDIRQIIRVNAYLWANKIKFFTNFGLLKPSKLAKNVAKWYHLNLLDIFCTLIFLFLSDQFNTMQEHRNVTKSILKHKLRRNQERRSRVNYSTIFTTLTLWRGPRSALFMMYFKRKFFHISCMSFSQTMR